jgi:flagellin-like hook-associated protein FlgL
MATGKSVNQPSDDPTAYAQTELLEQQQSAITNDVALATQAQSQLTTINGALSQASDILNSAIRMPPRVPTARSAPHKCQPSAKQ